MAVAAVVVARHPLLRTRPLLAPALAAAAAVPLEEPAVAAVVQGRREGPSLPKRSPCHAEWRPLGW